MQFMANVELGTKGSDFLVIMFFSKYEVVDDSMVQTIFHCNARAVTHAGSRKIFILCHSRFFNTKCSL